ncbi:50S ribosomal protein L21 [Cellulophaga lytica]|uniref:Large ribosomal subunit protein bL21 n=2 Tax=Cellulophaga TaxID=104264 RepID=F0RE87_CELLC|nr:MULTISPECIES: 50S ribosomal protein L21 [Cellulophaga]ADY28849.1 50S ribosomal protein L21 [Cellulophaga lytica DSM 7489]AIM59893.1 50S ribosomal protein L21 [Cellulophaga lytica]APU09758.1 50S ribosomal protein L21 [Cellulophaga lytica]EWH13140.1 50S ribosomal protein L21 [Cellulophaga geojensis KL-A]MDO6855023.1 50S ribosomal protein L21 [Cellulophaga lytica]
MYAIVEIAGQQFKVAKDQKVYVHRLQTEEGQKVTFDNVLLLENGKDITIGAPAIDGAAVEAKVVKHLKGDKVIVFKKKRRKGYKVKNGHRQYLTEIVIENILASGAKKAAPKKEAAPKKAEAKKAAPKKAAKADDLKKVEGIGPKIAETLAAAGISTFAELAKTDAAKISEIIADVRGNHVTDTWPAQAKLAAEGKWDELKKWQDELDGGKA